MANLYGISGLPCSQEGRQYEQNRLLETILAQPQLHSVFSQSLANISRLAADEAGKASLINNLQRYVDSRKAAAELSAILVGAAAGYAANQTVNVGALGLGKTWPVRWLITPRYPALRWATP